MKIARKFYYLYSLLFVFVIPTVIESYFIMTEINLLNLFAFMMSITIIGSLWDIWATRHGKKDPIWLWQFNKKDTLGITLLDLPIEEYLFYLATSSYIIFSWESVKSLSTGSHPELYVLLPCLTVWTLFFIGLPYVLAKKDRVN